MYRKLILLLVLAVLVIVFAAQNNHPVDVRLFSSQVKVSLSALVFLIFVIGALLGFSASVDGFRKNQKDEKDE